MAADTNQPITVKEIKRSFSEIRRWSHRKLYDPYFCAGEMVAALCEVLRIIRQRLVVTTPQLAAEVLLAVQEFHHTLVTELIDDSQGLREISEAHLDDIYKYLKDLHLPNEDSESVHELLQQFHAHQGSY